MVALTHALNKQRQRIVEQTKLASKGTANCSNASVVYVAATLGSDSKDDRSEFLQGYQRALPGVRILRGVNGYNHTEAIATLLHTGVPFYNLSGGGRYWGHLANIMTHYNMLMHQVEHRIPYQVTMEDDLVVQQPYFSIYINGACAAYERKRDSLHLLQLSQYSELIMTSLAGARYITEKMRKYGIRKNVDQQLLDHRVLGHRVGRHLNLYKFSSPTERPFRLGRRTNKGDIGKSRMLSWAEMALLRLVTDPRTRALASYGNPPNTDMCRATKCMNSRKKLK